MFGKSPGFMKQENTGNSDMLGTLNRGSTVREGAEYYILTVLLFASSWEIGNGACLGGGKWTFLPQALKFPGLLKKKKGFSNCVSILSELSADSEGLDT